MSSARGVNDRFNRRTGTRTVVTMTGALVALLGVVIIALTVGEAPTTLTDIVAALIGVGTPQDDLIVLGFRLPRALAGVAVGAALGASGAIFQSITRNPLGSPDIVGFTAGSATAAILTIVVFGGGTYLVAGGALVGGLVCAFVVLALASSGGTTTGYRFVLIGIGAAATLTAANGYLITRASLGDATAAQAWIVGSLHARGWETAVPLLVALMVLLPLALVSRRTLSVLELGDDVAATLGVRLGLARVLLVSCGIALAAAATAAAGPVGFIALAAPHIARPLTRSAVPPVGAAATLGALLLVASDVIAQRIFAPTVLPVGVVTGLVGGVYLGILLWTGRSRRAVA